MARQKKNNKHEIPPWEINHLHHDKAWPGTAMNPQFESATRIVKTRGSLIL